MMLWFNITCSTHSMSRCWMMSQPGKQTGKQMGKLEVNVSG